jgi:hypothetical protein
VDRPGSRGGIPRRGGAAATVSGSDLRLLWIEGWAIGCRRPVLLRPDCGGGVKRNRLRRVPVS